MVPCAPVIFWNWSIHCSSLSAMFNSLHSSMNQEVFEKHFCNKNRHYIKYGCKKHSVALSFCSTQNIELRFYIIRKIHSAFLKYTNTKIPSTFIIIPVFYRSVIESSKQDSYSYNWKHGSYIPQLLFTIIGMQLQPLPML